MISESAVDQDDGDVISRGHDVLLYFDYSMRVKAGWLGYIRAGSAAEQPAGGRAGSWTRERVRWCSTRRGGTRSPGQWLPEWPVPGVLRGDHKPDDEAVVIGHSFGGLLARIIAGRGLAASVAIDFAPSAACCLFQSRCEGRHVP